MTSKSQKTYRMKEAVTEFDEDLWSGMVETVTVQRDGSMVFRFIGAGKIRVKSGEKDKNLL